jgi:hypothetical protein
MKARLLVRQRNALPAGNGNCRKEAQYAVYRVRFTQMAAWALVEDERGKVVREIENAVLIRDPSASEPAVGDCLGCQA